MHGLNIVENLLKVALLGSTWVLYLLLGLSFVSLAAMLERWLYFRRQDDPALREKLSQALLADDFPAAERALQSSPGVVAEALVAALRFKEGGAEAVADATDSELGRVRPELERGLTLLGTIGNNAPFIGLFGTVIGVIQAFSQLGAAGANKGAAMGNVMSGIAEALVATGVGIFVAIPAVIAFNLQQKRIADSEGRIAALSKLLCAYLKTKDVAPGRFRQHASEQRQQAALELSGALATAGEE
jgi:biopolymer transport protein ExbB/biopolymer transport protein TolQ